MPQLNPKHGKRGKMTTPGKGAPSHVSFSIEHMTPNNSYNFNYFTAKQMRDELTARQEFEKLLYLLSCGTWMDVFKRRRDEFGGTEQLPYWQLNFAPREYEFSEDESVLSFRFGKGMRYRMIGIKAPVGDILHIIGFDFDYSAYDHGQ